MDTRFQIRRSPPRGLIVIGIAGALILGMIKNVSAASTFNPTLLVNTESFQTIDDGDGTTDVEVRFGESLGEKLIFNRTLGRFEFTDDLSVQGNLSGSSLRVSGNADIWGNIASSGSIRAGSSITATTSITAKTVLSGSTLRVSNNADVHGALAASGAIRTDGDLTINDDRGAVDAVLTFGNNTTNQTLKYLSTAQKFQFSKGVSVIGNLSGSTLNVDGNAYVRGGLSASGTIRTIGSISGATLNIGGNVTIKGQTYVFPTNTATAGQVLKNNGSNTLEWGSTALGNGSGNILSLHPEYPGAVYVASGSTVVGQLTNSYDSTNKENYYHWTTTKAALNDYWIAVRVKVPKNYAAWDAAAPITVRYRTNTTSAANNYLNIRLLDTANAVVGTTGGASLVSGVANTWATATITNVTGGTYTAGGYVTILAKIAATTTNFADLGRIDLNWSTTTP